MDKRHDDLAEKGLPSITLEGISSTINESTMLINSYLEMMSDEISKVSPYDSESASLFIERVFALSRALEKQMEQFDGMGDKIFELSCEAKNKVAGEAAQPA